MDRSRKEIMQNERLSPHERRERSACLIPSMVSMARLMSLASLAGLLLFAGCSHRQTISRNSLGLIFYLEYVEASRVALAASIDNFRLRPASRDKSGRWLVKGLPDEEFEYFYLVDGKVFTPECRFRQQDDFGHINCIHQP